MLRRAARPSLLFLVTVTTLGSMPLHLFIPALPVTARDLLASPGVVQLTITLYLVGLAVGQPIYGPLSDRFGRRPLLLGGLALFVLSSVMAAFASTAGQLIVTRVFQALGACGGQALGRAMVRDGTSPEKAAGAMAILVTALTVAPAIAPAIGGYVAGWLGWRAIFAVLAVVGFGVLLWAMLTLPETHHHRTPLVGIAQMLRTYKKLLRLPQFLGYTLAGCVSAAIYAYLSVSPFILVDVLRRPAQEIGLYYLLIVIATAAGSITSGRLVRRVGSRRLANIGTKVQLSGAVLLLLVHFTDSLSVAAFVAPAVLFSAGVGCTNPNAAANAVSAAPDAIGAASGLYGSMQMIFGALCTLVVGLWHANSVLPLATVMVVSTLMGLAAIMHAETSAAP